MAIGARPLPVRFTKTVSGDHGTGPSPAAAPPTTSVWCANMAHDKIHFRQLVGAAATHIAELTEPGLASLTPERLASHLYALRHRT